MTTAETDARALAFQRDPSPEAAALLWEAVRCYYFGLNGLRMMQGYHVSEVQGDAFVKMRDAALDYKPQFGVCFLLYFRIRLHGMLLSMRKMERLREGKAFDESMGGCREPAMCAEAERAMAREWLRSLAAEEPECALAREVVADWLGTGDATPSELEARAGLTGEARKRARQGLRRVAGRLIL